MRVLNCMFGKGKGGLEQAALDYHEALELAGCDVQSVLHTRADMLPAFAAQDAITHTLSPAGEWDRFASNALRKIAQREQSELIIAHGNRAISLALRALKGRIPVIGVAHNYNIQKRFPKCDAVFCITRDLIEELVHLEMRRDQLFHIPNLIRTQDISPRTTFREPVSIGTLGRFVEKKGMDIFIQSLQALSQHRITFNARIGGDGPLTAQLQHQAEQLGLADKIEFTGWVADKDAFFESLDIFVLPSHHEPFGIVLIEAMAAGLPCITTDTEGPCEIIAHNVDAMMIEKDKPYTMAQALRELIEHPAHTLRMGEAAHQKAKSQYDIHIVSEKLHAAIKHLARLAERQTEPIS